MQIQQKNKNNNMKNVILNYMVFILIFLLNLLGVLLSDVYVNQSLTLNLFGYFIYFVYFLIYLLFPMTIIYFIGVTLYTLKNRELPIIPSKMIVILCIFAFALGWFKFTPFVS
jgi:hypothetical protein